jgi:polyisoprenoid-binding protein YceI
MRIFLTGLVLFLIVVSSPQAEEWVLQDGNLTIAARYEGQPVPAVFHRFAVSFDDAPATRRLHVEVDVTSIDFDSGDINDAVVGKDWFDTAQYPRAAFTSERVESTGNGQFLAVGTLELKGTKRTVEVPFEWVVEQSRRHLRGELQLQRNDFRIGTGEWANATEIGQEVDIRFDVRLQRSQEELP